MSVGSTELIGGVGWTEPLKSEGSGSAAAGAEKERRRLFCRRRQREIIGQPKVVR
jgi:hypothetical protein